MALAPLRVALFAVLCLGLQAFAGNGQWTLIGWNNSGVHSVDEDFSVFTLSPPYNTVDAQLMDAAGKLIKISTGLTLTYEALTDLDGSRNRSSLGKTNFWDFATVTGYGNASVGDRGLSGNTMPGLSNTPQLLKWNSSYNWFEGVGIPLVPRDDAGHVNPYPMMRLTAKNSVGTVLAKADVVLPVSAEMNCRACHASGSGPDAQPGDGWVNDPNPLRDDRLNILRLHDERRLGDAVYQAALTANGFRSDGLFNTVTMDNKPILCAKCHASAAPGIPGTAVGAPGVDSLTRSMHLNHSTVKNPSDGLLLENMTTRSACYLCHPGASARCLRGSMGAGVAVDGSFSMQCQGCHGKMSQLAVATRVGWVDEPNCQSCHTGDATLNNGLIRYTTALETTGKLRVAVNSLFATTPNTPTAGKSLYSLSTGHGGLQCAACHGASHAEFPSTHRDDNVQSVQLQGYAGTVMECTACHATMPSTYNGGPHGMHPITAGWATSHTSAISAVGFAVCQSCHGTDYRGTVLSRATTDRSFSTKYGTKNYTRGTEIGCYSCHNGISNNAVTPHVAPTVTSGTLAVPAGKSASVSLAVTGAGSTVRISRQPAHGTVALSGTVATYLPEAGYTGPDSFTYIGSNSGGYIDSQSAGLISVTVGTLSRDSDGDGLPDLLEYALGLSPQLFSLSSATVPTTELVGGVGYRTMTLSRFLAPTDATVRIEVSGDMVTWSPATIISSTPSLLKARDTVSTSAAGKRFMRVRVTRP